MIYRDIEYNSLETYGNSLPKSYKKFLESNDHRGFSSRMDDTKNPYQTRKDIMKKLGKSLFDIHRILKLSKNLKRDEIYEIFNASNIQIILESLLRNTEKNHNKENTSQYDFRTCEIARLMSELSLKYLKDSPMYKDIHSVKEITNSISRDFRKLSESMLEKEDGYKTISKYEQEKILSKYLEIEDKVDSYPYESSKELFIEIQRLDFEYNELKKLKRTNYMKSNREKRKEEYKKYQKRLDYETKLENNEFRNKSLLGLKMNEKYKHIALYFSRISPLADVPIMKINKKN